jgi:hypothetical protein
MPMAKQYRAKKNQPYGFTAFILAYGINTHRSKIIIKYNYIRAWKQL